MTPTPEPAIDERAVDDFPAIDLQLDATRMLRITARIFNVGDLPALEWPVDQQMHSATMINLDSRRVVVVRSGVMEQFGSTPVVVPPPPPPRKED